MNRGAKITTYSLVGAAAGMLALSFAAEPLYSTFCKVTGFGGTTQVAKVNTTVETTRPIRVRFDANVDPGAPLEFKPEQGHVDGRLGETILAFYNVKNVSDHPVEVIAGYNVAPHKVGTYFSKVQCFCFTKRMLQAGASERLPVVFFVDPKLDKDPYARDVKTITLSYTYYLAASFGETARLETTTTVN